MPARLGREEERVERQGIATARDRWIALLGLLCAPLALPGQAPEWQASIARVSVTLKDTSRLPGTAIVVAVRGQTAYLVTCAHVVEGDLNPKVEFMAVADRTFTATRKDFQDEGKRGLALLIVNDVPREVRAVALAAQAKPVMGERVIVAGFPAAVSSSFTVVDAIVSNARGTDITLSRETGPGFSGGPVLRGDTAIGLVYGEEGRFGLALLTNVVTIYLEGLGVVLTGALPLAEPAATRVAPIDASATPKPQPRRAGSTKVNPKDGLRYVWVPPGTFQMGCSAGDKECEADEKPAHPVTITKGFWMGQTEVTQAAYQRVTGKNPSNFKGFDLPVEQVSWGEAESFCKVVGMRLPTEAEWEYAARAGSTASRYGDIDRVAWCQRNSDARTHPVAKKEANAWSLHDMLGNVWEWTADWYGQNYYRARASQDPQGPPGGTQRVLRGGSWGADLRDVRVSYRGTLGPESGFVSYGFRCAGE